MKAEVNASPNIRSTFFLPPSAFFLGVGPHCGQRYPGTL